jgi:hypothetical protein
MKKSYLLATLFAVTVFDANAAMDHSQHRGGGTEMGSATCVRPQLSKMQPAHLSTVTPGSAFSFVLSNIDDPKQVSVQIKKQDVDFITEFKDPYYVIKGKIPDSLRNTAARVDVKIDSKIASCRATEGWLVKISEN